MSEFADHLRVKINESEFVFEAQTLNVTVSIGGAEIYALAMPRAPATVRGVAPILQTWAMP